MKKLLFSFLLIIGFLNIQSQEVSISGNKFTVDGREIWFNGINTPWHLFVDFGRSDFDPAWWADEFARYKDNNINLARVWIYCSGEVSPNIDETGYVSGASNLYWEHMDYLMQIAEDNKVYVLPALFSFDITKEIYPTSDRWRLFLQSESNIQGYIDNVLVQMVQRYNNKPYLLGWEICNEPEWMFSNSEHGPQSFDDVQRFHAMLAAAIHENCDKPVTTGSAAPKWNSPIYDAWGDHEGNMFSDEALSSTINNPNAFLDFYQYHWYPWQSEWMGSPFTKTTAEYQVDDRPVIVGESEGNDVCDAYICQTITEMYESALNNGFDGVCAWKTPQNDGYGTFDNIAVATNAFYNNHPNLVYPIDIVPVDVTGISLSEGSVTVQIRDTYTLSANIIPSDATDKRITWTSSDEAVATIANGKITAEGIGVATITAKTIDGGYTATCAVEVIERQAICSSPEVKTLPLSQDGAGTYCYIITGTIDNINSWGMDHLEINSVDYSNSYSSTMPERVDGAYYIYYEASASWSHMEIGGSNGTVEEYTLTVNVDGGGTVSGAGSYIAGTTATLTATADAGYEFSGWSGAVTGTSATVSVLMDGLKTVTATFTQVPNPVEYTLTVAVAGEGAVTPGTAAYTEGTVVELTAQPAAGFIFAGWSGASNGPSLTTSVTMDANKTITATFTEDIPVYYTLTVNVSGNGTVMPDGGSFLAGTVVALVATPDTDNHFASWSGDADGISASISLTMNSDKSVAATFAPDVCCGIPITIALPFSQDGVGQYYWFTSDDISYINSWNMEAVTINGVDFTNTYSNTMPPKSDGGYYIEYTGLYGWSHFEASGLKGAGSMDNTIALYPNPFSTDITIDFNKLEDVRKIELYSSLGQLVQTIDASQIHRKQIQIDINSSGNYFLLRLYTGTDIITKKIIRQ